jgi:hypothetical protein
MGWHLCGAWFPKAWKWNGRFFQSLETVPAKVCFAWSVTRPMAKRARFACDLAGRVTARGVWCDFPDVIKAWKNSPRIASCRDETRR